ncbi:hypothetical protein Tco_0314121 [Tanacetum coccineum]
MGGSSQPSQPPMSPINAFSLEDLYTPDLSQNTAYWQEPNPYEATGEQVATSSTKKKKATRNRQKRLTQTDDAPRQIAWTTEEEVALAKEQNKKAKAAAKNKGSKASASSTMNDDALTKLVVTEMTATEVEQRKKFIELKRREVECRERKIAATEYRAQQEDMKLYLQQYDHLTGEQRFA